MKRIIENVFIGVLVASNVSFLIHSIITDATVLAPVWADALFILATVLSSYWWARLLIWLARQSWRGLNRVRRRRSGSQ